MREHFVITLLFCLSCRESASERSWQTVLVTGQVQAIAETSAGLWVGTSEGLIRVDPKTGDTAGYASSRYGIPALSIHALATDKDGFLWIGTSAGLSRFDTSVIQSYTTSNSALPANGIRFLRSDPPGRLWIGTQQGLTKLDGTTFTTYKTSNSGLPSNDVTDVAVGPTGALWVGTWGKGIGLLENANWTVLDTGNTPMRSPFIFTIIADRQTIWVGEGGGLGRIRDNQWLVYSSLNSALPQNDVTTIAVDDDGVKWLGTYEGGLASFASGDWTIFNTDNSPLPTNQITEVFIDRRNAIWVGTNHGLLVFR